TECKARRVAGTPEIGSIFRRRRAGAVFEKKEDSIMRLRKILAAVAIAFGVAAGGASARDRWTPEQARAWHERMPWLVGSNFAPASAINQLEMWQADTFDP